MRRVITGELKSKIDRVWDAFWSGGISNPLEVIEQITYLLFLRRLDDLQTLAEKKARVTGGVIENPVFLPGQEHLRWSRFKNLDPEVMYKTVADEVFPFLQVRRAGRRRRLDLLRAHEGRPVHHPDPGAAVARSSTCSTTSRWPTATPTATCTSTCSPRSPRAGVNGQFRTPRHIIELMVDMTAPAADRRDLRPGLRHRRLPGRRAASTSASTHPTALTDATQRQHFHRSMFHGYDFDSTMLRIGSMNMLLHGIESPDIRYRDSLSEGASEDADEVHPDPRQPAVRRVARLRGHRPRTCSGSSRPRRPSCSSSRCSSSCSSPAAGQRSSSPTACCSARPRRTRTCAGSWSRTRSSTPS